MMLIMFQPTFGYLGVSGLSDGLHGKPLSGIVLNARKEDQSNGRAVFFDRRKNIILAEGEFTFSGRQLYNSFLRIETMKRRLRSECVLKCMFRSMPRSAT